MPTATKKPAPPKYFYAVAAVLPIKRFAMAPIKGMGFQDKSGSIPRIHHIQQEYHPQYQYRKEGGIMYAQVIFFAPLIFFHTRPCIQYKRYNTNNAAAGNRTYKKVL